MSTETRLKVAVLGLGQRACFHGGLLFNDVKERVEMVVVCDIYPERLEFGQKAYSESFEGPVRGYTDYREMFKKENLDGVFITGPNYLHRDMTISAFENGIHVLCEKPMEVTLQKCDEMLEAAKKHNKVLAFGMQMHYRKRYFKVKEIIESGAIGKVAQLWCTEYRGPYGKMKDWVWDKEKSGGAIFEKNCHHYDLLNWWADSKPTTVYATGNIMKHNTPYGIKSEIVDNAWILNNYENGASAMVGICFLSDHSMSHQREFGVHGTEGKIFFSWHDNEIIHVRYNNQHEEHFDMRKNQWIRGGLEGDFLDCMATGKAPLVTGEVARSSLLVPMAAEKSIEEQRIVNISEL